ncbi:MAG TPA: DNA recombination protein RmuC [Rhodopila sp.]|uniref:DNA recombination protein RmuC n=1 Tax=Rhodopila sp. TaxID=2480087 RepID=UPI002C943D79|nr:DNA recombination protein RmuC [Rhodopila sp.]HVY15808.1 DNA recombination protein RmuC [Rhodopila sp.]
METLLPLTAALAVLVAAIACILCVRQARGAQVARLLLEQTQASLRAEAETTRATLRAMETAQAERMGSLRGGLDISAEQVRTALAEGQLRSAGRTAEQFETVRQLLDAKLKELRESNDQRLAEIQKTVNEQLHAAVEKQMGESFNRVIDQFTAVQKAMGDVQAVTAQIGDIRRLFSNVKTRGGWGETQVRAMLDDILPPGAYETNRRVRPDSDEAVEFAVIMPMRGDVRPVLPIDAKFPVEDYERLLAASEAGDLEAERTAARALERRIRDEARKIAAKYIVPPATVEFAVLYLPTDALYAEVARIPGLVDEIGRDCRVLVMGPTLFPALLRTIHLGFVTLALEHKADQIRDLLGATRTEMLKMDDVLGRLSKQVGFVSATIERARVRTRAVGRKLRGVEQVEAEKASALLELETEPPSGNSDETDAISDD